MEYTTSGLEAQLADLDKANLVFRKELALFIKKRAINNRRIDWNALREGNSAIASIEIPADSTAFYVIGYISDGYMSDLVANCRKFMVKNELQAAASSIIQADNLYQLVIDSFQTNKSLADNLLAFRVFRLSQAAERSCSVDTCIFIRLNGIDPQNYKEDAFWVEVSKHSKKEYNFIFLDRLYNAKASTEIDTFARKIGNDLLALDSLDIYYATQLANLAQRKLNSKKV